MRKSNGSGQMKRGNGKPVAPKKPPVKNVAPKKKKPPVKHNGQTRYA